MESLLARQLFNTATVFHSTFSGCISVHLEKRMMCGIPQTTQIPPQKHVSSFPLMNAAPCDLQKVRSQVPISWRCHSVVAGNPHWTGSCAAVQCTEAPSLLVAEPNLLLCVSGVGGPSPALGRFISLHMKTNNANRGNVRRSSSFLSRCGPLWCCHLHSCCPELRELCNLTWTGHSKLQKWPPPLTLPLVLQWAMSCSASMLHNAGSCGQPTSQRNWQDSLIWFCPLLSIISQCVHETNLTPNSNLDKSERFGSFKRNFGQQKWEKISWI